ncbi:mediator of RNA polymerase II transcription subunit 10b-like [Nicotiana sylvestris]|uniref:Mediator of RNA polymerase II transcription subunit 10 n=1 Tax=Nicotiana sylvestris TaxID=4096 RepID=A0A1U7VKR7_NICSY|nr:PREDICTED: mediator of RNA polymerase II transcription subunit 10b-like [Nicotiana sylvestris]
MNSSKNSSSAGSIGGNGIINPIYYDASQANAAATTAVSLAEDLKQNLNQSINSIEKTLGILHKLYLTVSSQLLLIQRLNNLVLELDNMATFGEKCNIQVPIEVLNLIDNGKNPDEFTRDVLNNCIVKNQITKGKTDAFKGLRRHLLEELEQTFPEEAEAYGEIRAASAAGADVAFGLRVQLNP